MYIIGASAAFSRMAITLIHDTLTHLTVPMIQLEMLLPIVGVVVATHAPEHNVNFIKASCALASACWSRALQTRHCATQNLSASTVRVLHIRDALNTRRHTEAIAAIELPRVIAWPSPRQPSLLEV